MPANTTEIEKRLWEAADDLRANSKLKSSEYSIPVLGLIFLRYSDYRFEQTVKTLQAASPQSRRRTIGKADYQARGVLYLRDEARFANLLKLPEGANIGAAINAAMKAIEDENDDLRGVLPQKYSDDDYRVKCDAVYQHVYDSYYGAGRSVYAATAEALEAAGR